MRSNLSGISRNRARRAREKGKEAGFRRHCPGAFPGHEELRISRL